MIPEDQAADKSEAAPAASELATVSFAYAEAFNSRAQSLLPVIIPVRAYDGETEEQALKRQGFDASRPGVELEFVHIN
jgi:hypothetical protein